MTSTREATYRPHYWTRVPTANSHVNSQAGIRLLTDKVADLITFLAVSHEMALDMTFITWRAPIGPETYGTMYGPLGFGGTAEVQQRTLHLQKSLAFKRPKAGKGTESSPSQGESPNLDGEYRNLSSEIQVLCCESVRHHPNIITIEAVCWDYNAKTGLAWPVLIFDRAEESDLETFMNTSQGLCLDNRKRLEFCQDVALAMIALHRYGIVHGDINPRNLLVFRDLKDGVFIRMSDFGYASLMYEGDQISMPSTLPWTAPEIESGSVWLFEFEDARRTDYYSFALVCAALLWYGESEDDRLSSMRFTVPVHQAIRQARRQNTLVPQVLEIVQSLKDVEIEHKSHLKKFFEQAFEDRPENRTLHLQGLFFEYAQRTEQGKMVFDDIEPKFFARPEIPWAAQFKVTKVWPRAIIGDFRLWSAIFEALDIQTKSHPDKPCRQNAAFQMAVCFELGFGCTQSHVKSSEWLEASCRSLEAFEAEMKSIQSPLYWVKAGQDAQNWGNADPTPAYVDEHLLSEAETMHRKALSNMRHTFSESHPLIHEQRIVVCQILIGLSRWQEAYDMASATLDDCRKHNVPAITLTRAIEAKREVCAEFFQYHEVEALWTELNSRRTRPRRMWRDTGSNSYSLALLRQEGIIKLGTKDYAAAEQIFVRLTESTEAYYGSESDGAIEAKALLAILHALCNRPDKIQMLQEALALCEKHNTMYTRCEALRLRILLCRPRDTRRERNEALKRCIQIVEDCQAELGPNHKHTFAATEELSSIYFECGDFVEAQSAQQAVVEASKTTYGENQPVTAFSQLRLAFLLRFDVRWEEALQLAEPATEVLRLALSAQHREVVFWTLELGIWRTKKRVWEFVGLFFPLGVITAVGRRLNRLIAWTRR